ncbi:hypothetical protein GW17_00004968 [Ensete ventricosum]|nr:hypothetical protein GW17_00004968 [Ensete ventricosum]
MASPFARATDHDHTPCRGGRPRPDPLHGRPAVAKAAGLAHKGLLLVASPTANRGGGNGRKGGRSLVGRLPTAKGRRRQRRGDDTVKAKRTRAFKKKR